MTSRPTVPRRTVTRRREQIVLTFQARTLNAGLVAVVMVVGVMLAVAFFAGRASALREGPPVELAPAPAVAGVRSSTPRASSSTPPLQGRDAGDPLAEASHPPLQGLDAGDSLTEASHPQEASSDEAKVEASASLASGSVQTKGSVSLASGSVQTKGSDGPVLRILSGRPRYGFGVQLGAYPSREDAEAFVGRHADVLGRYPVYIVPTRVEGRDDWHRIRVGRFKSRRQAEAVRLALPEELGESALVVSYR